MLTKEFNLIEVATALGREKALVFGVPFAFALITAIYSLSLKPIFTARTVILPPQVMGSTNPFAGQGALAQMAFGMGAMKNPAELYVGLLKSESVRDKIIEHFHLQDRYHTKTRVDTLRTLDGQVEITPDRFSGFIAVEVSDKEPQFAADLANYHIEAAKHLLGRLSLSEAQEQRDFLERQIDTVANKPYRDLRIQEAVLANLIRQSEIARLDEAREGKTLQQIDIAFPPDRRSKPKRTAMVMMAAIVGFVLGGALALGRQAFGILSRDPQIQSRLSELKNSWCWIPFGLTRQTE